MSEASKTTVNVPNSPHDHVNTFSPFSYQEHEMLGGSLSIPNLKTPPNWDIQLRITEHLLASRPGLVAEQRIGELENLYDFRDGVVNRFLEENASLTDLLFKAHMLIQEHFGSEAESALEVVVDPEALGDQQLFVLIRSELPRKEARARLAELDREWWLGALPAAEGKMEIALD